MSADKKEDWFDACKSDSRMFGIMNLLLDGFDPDTRDEQGNSGLWYAADASNNRNTMKVAELIIRALTEKYKKDPALLIAALEAGPNGQTPADRFYQDFSYNIIRQKIKQRIDYAREDISNQPLTSDLPTVSLEPAFTSSAMPSDSSLSTQSDAKVTVTQLLRVKDGKTHLQILAEQGQLNTVFSEATWVGRKEEMDQAWEYVPKEYRNQVNIEVIRGKLAQSSLRERLKIDKDTSWEQGF